MSDKSYGQILGEGFVRAIPWAIVFSAAFLITMAIAVVVLKPEVKKAIVFAEQSAISATTRTVLSDAVLPKVKQNAKEAIEYTVKTVDRDLMEPHKRLASAKK